MFRPSRNTSRNQKHRRHHLCLRQILPWPVAAKPERAPTASHRKGLGKYDASKAAHDAYRNALPPLSGVENIRDFIACVAHGMLIDSIRDCVAARLLYAAK